MNNHANFCLFLRTLKKPNRIVSKPQCFPSRGNQFVGSYRIYVFEVIALLLVVSYQEDLLWVWLFFGSTQVRRRHWYDNVANTGRLHDFMTTCTKVYGGCGGFCVSSGEGFYGVPSDGRLWPMRKKSPLALRLPLQLCVIMMIHPVCVHLFRRTASWVRNHTACRNRDGPVH